MTESQLPQLVAHRGYLAQYPENTWTGLEAALTAGACWLEFDVQMCADGQFVLLHDADLARTAGIPRSAFELDLDSLRRYSVHEPQRFGERFAPAEVPALAAIMARLTRFAGARAMVEIKEESLDHWGLQPVMDELLQQLEAYRNQCVVISFNRAAIDYTLQNSSIEAGWVLHRYDQEHYDTACELTPHYLICNETKIPAHEAPWRGSWQWMLYDISDPARALHWATRGVSLIETADIGAMLQHPQLAPGACQYGL